MWIKTSNNCLVQTKQFKCITYRKHDGWTVAWDADGEYLLCKGNALETIAQAIQRDQKYLEVSDCG